MADNAIVAALLPVINSILDIRRQTGYLGRLYRVTRIFNPDGIGYTETQEEIVPVPGVSLKPDSFDQKMQGLVKLTVLRVTEISKANYPTADLLETFTDPNSATIYLYKFQEYYFTCTKLEEDYVYWNMELTKYDG